MKKPDNKKVGQRIKNIRISKGYTMETFAELLNGTKGGVNNWEKGRHLPNKEKLKKIADLDGISVNELLYGSGKVKIKPWSLFSNSQDLRQYMSVDMHEEDLERLIYETGISYEDIYDILERAQIFVRLDKLPEYIEVDEYEV